MTWPAWLARSPGSVGSARPWPVSTSRSAAPSADEPVPPSRPAAPQIRPREGRAVVVTAPCARLRRSPAAAADAGRNASPRRVRCSVDDGANRRRSRAPAPPARPAPGGRGRLGRPRRRDGADSGPRRDRAGQAPGAPATRPDRRDACGPAWLRPHRAAPPARPAGARAGSGPGPPPRSADPPRCRRQPTVDRLTAQSSAPGMGRPSARRASTACRSGTPCRPAASTTNEAMAAAKRRPIAARPRRPGPRTSGRIDAGQDGRQEHIPGAGRINLAVGVIAA